RPELAHQVVGGIPADAEGEVRARKRLAGEGLHIVQRDGTKASFGAERYMPVRRAAEDGRLKTFLAKFLLVVRPQVLHEGVLLARLEPIEILGPPARAEQLREDHINK